MIQPITLPGLGYLRDIPPLSSFLGVPLKNNGKTTGIIGVSNREGGYTDSQQKALEQLAPAIIETIMRKRAEDAIVDYNEELEQKIEERTTSLKASEERYRLLVENASEAVVVAQGEKLIFFNKQTEELSGYSKEELAKRSFVNFFLPEDRDTMITYFRARIRGENVPSRYELRVLDKNGRIKWVDINTSFITWNGYPAVLGLITDITERKNLEQTLRDYAIRITQVQEEERKRIAYELHDDTAQYVALLKLEIDSILNSGEIQSPRILEKLKYLNRDASRAVDDIRRYSHELRPGVLEHLGLQAALEQMAEDHNKLGQIHVYVNVDGVEPDLSEDIRLGFFRIAQEAISNARKHARVPSALVKLNFNDHKIIMLVSDKGIGFDPQKAVSRLGETGSLGLMSMQERARLIGANLKIDSQPGQGTTIRVEKLLSN